MGPRKCDRLAKCKWFTRASGTLYQTGLQGNKTVVQVQTAANEWIANRKARASETAWKAPIENHDISKRDSLQDLRLYGRTPDDPYVRACMAGREHALKEEQRLGAWTASLERCERNRARDRERYKAHDPPDSKQPERPGRTVWTRPGTVASGAAGGGHHMLSRSNMRDLLYMLPNPAIPLTDFSEYERITSAQDDRDMGRKVGIGRDFLGCRRAIEPVGEEEVKSLMKVELVHKSLSSLMPFGVFASLLPVVHFANARLTTLSTHRNGHVQDHHVKGGLQNKELGFPSRFAVQRRLIEKMRNLHH
jgi:hypothetical protein